MAWRHDVVGTLARELKVPQRAAIAVVAPGGRTLELLRAAFPGSIAVRLDDRGSGGPLGGGAVPEGACLDAAVLWFVGTSAPRPWRRDVLATVARALRGGATMAVVDHNRPRRWWQRIGNVAWCAWEGVDPRTRPAYPVAREVQELGFERIALRFACAERVQLVYARRGTPP